MGREADLAPRNAAEGILGGFGSAAAAAAKRGAAVAGAGAPAGQRGRPGGNRIDSTAQLEVVAF